jgi:putative transferase (TIGR04331 family)
VLLVDINLPRRQLFRLMGRTGFKARWCELPQPEAWLAETAGSPASSYREGLGHLVAGQTDTFVRVLINTLPAHLPLLYLEGYRACREWVKRNWDGSHTRTAVTASALIGNETFKFLAAALKERGARLIEVQHGGAYGSARYNPMEVLQKGTGDQVWSWGWGGESANGVKPMPNPNLSLVAQKRRGHSGSGRPFIFYVGNNIPRYHYRTWSCPTAGQGAQYLDWQVRFLKALQTETRAGLIFRPYPLDYGWDLRRRLLDACPGLRLDDPANDYYAELQEASLVVCDMNQTTLLESLAANIPTIAFWDPHLWELRAEAEADFQLLRAAGILHHEPEGAAAAVNDFWPQAADWWNQTGVQQAREQFVQRHALNAPEWARQWSDCLNNIIADTLPEGLDRGRSNHF